jgi:hypothetical protein
MGFNYTIGPTEEPLKNQKDTRNECCFLDLISRPDSIRFRTSHCTSFSVDSVQ